MELGDTIRAAQSNDQEAMMTLIDSFQPLLKKYARKLGYEDAVNDVRLDFIGLIRRIKLGKLASVDDKYILSYVNVSMANAYKKRLAEMINRGHADRFSELSERELYAIESANAVDDDGYSLVIVSDVLSRLPGGHKQILHMHYVERMTVDEIAGCLRVSRQTVNQAKLRALEKLRGLLSRDGLV